MPRFQLLRLALLLCRDSGNLDFVQLVVELLIEAEHICLTDVLAHGFLLQHIPSLHAKNCVDCDGPNFALQAAFSLGALMPGISQELLRF